MPNYRPFLYLDLHHVLGRLTVLLRPHNVEHTGRLLGGGLDQRDLSLAVPGTDGI